MPKTFNAHKPSEPDFCKIYYYYIILLFFLSISYEISKEVWKVFPSRFRQLSGGNLIAEKLDYNVKLVLNECTKNCYINF